MIVEFRVPSVEEYQQLRASTGWSSVADARVAAALAGCRASVCAVAEGHVIGTGRILGDGMYSYVQDLVVLTSWRGRGVGTALLDALLTWHDREQPGPIGLMAAPGTEAFYLRAGFVRRAEGSPGMVRP